MWVWKKHFFLVFLLFLVFTGWTWTCLRRGCISVKWTSSSAHRWCRFDSPVRQGIFLLESTVSADSLAVLVQPPCDIPWFNICAHVKNPKHWKPYPLSGYTRVLHHILSQPPKTERGCRSGRRIENGHIRNWSPGNWVWNLHKKRNAEEESSAPCSKSELLVLSDYKV